MSGDAQEALARARFDETALEPVPVDRSIVLEGEPTWEMAIVWRSADNTKVVGLFRGTPGRFRYGHSADETTFIRSGRMIVTAEDGTVAECGAGDILTLRRDVSYVFDIQETLEEVFVMTSENGVAV